MFGTLADTVDASVVRSYPLANGRVGSSAVSSNQGVMDTHVDVAPADAGRRIHSYECNWDALASSHVFWDQEVGTSFSMRILAANNSGISGTLMGAMVYYREAKT